MPYAHVNGFDLYYEAAAQGAVLATYDIRRANCSLFATDLLIGRGLGEYVLVIPDRTQ